MVFTSLSYRLRLILLTAFVIIVTLAVAACGKSNSGARQGNRDVRTEGGAGAAEAADAPIVAVTTVRVETREVPTFIQATGSLTANESSDVASQVSGQVISTPVNIGAFVRQGAVIA